MMKLSLVCLMALAAAVVFAKDYELVKDNKPSSCIVLPDNAGQVEKHAAGELSLFLEKVTGANVKIESVPSKDLYNIHLGTTEAKSMPRSAAIDKAVSQLKDDGFLLAADKDGIRVISKKPVGVLYGAYEILKKYADMRWFAPGADFEYCPKKPTVAVPEQITVSNPSFNIRLLGLVCANWNSKTIDTWDWQVRNNMTVTLSRRLYYQSGIGSEVQKRGAEVGRDGGHCFVNLLSDKLFDEHPEYFGLFDGKRMKQDLGDGRGARLQPCTSNPAVVEIMTESLKKILSTPPAGRGIYLIGNNDADAWCQCENCIKLDPPEEKRKKYVSTRYWTLINKIAAEVFKTYPDADIWAWGYQNYQYPPTGIIPDPRVKVEAAIHGRCYRHSMGDLACAANDKYRDILTQWKKFKNNVFTLEYADCNPNYLPIEKAFADDIKYYKRIGLSGCSMFTVPPDGVFGAPYKPGGRYWGKGVEDQMVSLWQQYYITAKLLWDVNADYDKIYEDMGSKYYGKAWPVMSQYRALLTKSFVETSGHICYGTPDYVIGKCLEKPGVEAKLVQLLEEAEKMAGNDQAVSKRIKLDYRYFQTYWQALHKAFLGKKQSELKVNKKTDKIIIDGKLEESDWKKADFTSGFIALDGKTGADPQTFVKILYDDNNIYLAVEAMEPEPGKMKISAKERDGAVYSDNSLEFFISSPGMDAMIDTQGRYAHIVVNPNGVIYDSMAVGGGNADTSYNSQAEIKTTVLKDRWIAEIRIPATALLSKIQDGETWKINVARNRKLVDVNPQLSSWSNGIFHGPEAFRSVVLGGSAFLTNGDFEDLEKFSEMPSYRKSGFTGTKWKFIGDSFPRVWGIHQYAGEVEIIDGGAAAGRKFLRIKCFTDAKGNPSPAVITQQRLPIKEAGTLILRAKLRGKGEFTPYAWRYNFETGRPMPDFAAKIGQPLKVDSKEWVNFEGSVYFDGKSYFSLALYFTSAEGIDIDNVTITRGEKKEQK
jgi:hypothetical protein